MAEFEREKLLKAIKLLCDGKDYQLAGKILTIEEYLEKTLSEFDRLEKKMHNKFGPDEDAELEMRRGRISNLQAAIYYIYRTEKAEFIEDKWARRILYAPSTILKTIEFLRLMNERVSNENKTPEEFFTNLHEVRKELKKVKNKTPGLEEVRKDAA